MFKFLIPALFLALAPLSATADESLVQSDFDVAGVTLGMQPDAVRVALEERGYVLGEDSRAVTRRGPSFEQMRAIEAGTLKKRDAKDSWSEMTFRRGDSEGVYVRFKPLRVGVSASVVVYVNTVMSFDDFKVAAAGKYGPPLHEHRALMLWSALPLPNGTQVRDGSGAISLAATNRVSRSGGQGFKGTKVSLTLKGGKVGLADPKADVEAAIPETKTTF